MYVRNYDLHRDLRIDREIWKVHNVAIVPNLSYGSLKAVVQEIQSFRHKPKT